MPFIANIIDKISPLYPRAKRWLHSFNGGVFPSYNKELSSRQPIKDTLIPERLIIPLQQQVGQPAELLVKVGDKVKKNQLIAHSSKDPNKALVVPIHAPTSGVIEAIDYFTLPHPSGLKDVSIIIKTDQLNESIDNSLNVSKTRPQTPQQLREIILKAGIIGMGGAGYPTYAKLATEKGMIHTIIINGAECEPFITCDDLLMQTEAADIIQGAIITADALGATKILCGIENNKPTAIKAMKQAAQNTIIEVMEVPTVYPMGGQKQLTHELTGVEMPSNSHAVDVGILMMNVATFSAIYRAVIKGEPLTSRLVSVTGLGLAKPFNTRALIGTPFDALVKLARPKTSLDYPLIMGGPLMGFAVQNNQVPVIKTTNCILANPPEPTEMQMPCIRCGECMDACPVNLLPQQMYWHSQAHEFDKVEKLNVFDCIECGCCSYVCPSHIPLVQYYRNAKSEIKEIHAEEKATELAKQRHEFKLARIEREKQEREARIKAKKEAVKKQPSATEPATSSKPKAAAAAAKAKAAAAKRAAAQKENKTIQQSSPENTDNAIPPARRKAIEAAKQAALKGADNKTAEANAKQAAKQAAINKAKQAAEKTNSASNANTPANETPAVETHKDPKKSAKAAAMAAAKKRAQQKNLNKTESSESTSSATSEADSKSGSQQDPIQSQATTADEKKRQAMALAKQRAAQKAAQRAAKKSTEETQK